MRTICRESGTLFWTYWIPDPDGYGDEEMQVTVTETKPRRIAMLPLSVVDMQFAPGFPGRKTTYTLIVPEIVTSPSGVPANARALGLGGVIWRGDEYEAVENFDHRRVGRAFLECKVQRSVTAG